MATMTATAWTVATLAAIAYVAACVAAARLAGRSRGGRVAWLAVSIAATPVPAVVAIVLRRRRRRRQLAASGLRRCPHCQNLIDSGGGERGASVLCPRCGLPVNEAHLA